MGCHVLLQGIFLAQVSNLCLLLLLHYYTGGGFFTTSNTWEAKAVDEVAFIKVVKSHTDASLLISLGLGWEREAEGKITELLPWFLSCKE